MIEGKIIQDQEFIHKRTGVVYTVVYANNNQDSDTQTLAKLGQVDEWTPAVVYYNPHNESMTFVRDEARFRETFERA